MIPKSFFVGFTACPHPLAERYYGPLTPPRNYKKPDAIAEWVEKAAEARREDSAFLPIVGSIQEVVVLDNAGREVLQIGGPSVPLGTAGPVFCSFVAREAREGGDPRFIGFRIGDLARVAYLESVAAGRVLDAGSYYLAAQLGHSDALFDPYRWALPEPARAVVDLKGFLRHLGIQVVEADLASPRGLACVARDVVLKVEWPLIASGALSLKSA